MQAALYGYPRTLVRNDNFAVSIAAVAAPHCSTPSWRSPGEGCDNGVAKAVAGEPGFELVGPTRPSALVPYRSAVVAGKDSNESETSTSEKSSGPT